MKSQILKQKDSIFILIAVLIAALGVQGISYAQEGAPTITASVEAPLTESDLNGSIVTLTLSGGSFERWRSSIRSALTISGVDGVTVSGSWDVDRINDTKVTVELTFSGNIDVDTHLVFTVGAGAIADYDGDALTAQLPVTAVAETLVATTESISLEATRRENELVLTESPLTEENLFLSVIRLTLNGRQFTRWWKIEDALTISSPDGRIIGVSEDDDEVEINGEVIERDDWKNINDIGIFIIDSVAPVSGSEVLVSYIFFGDLSADATLTLTVGADAILGYNEDFTFEFPITAVEESLTATTEFPLTEENIDGSTVRLSSERQFWFSGRQLWFSDASDELEEEGSRGISISGIEGVTIEGIVIPLITAGIFMGDPTIILGFDGDFDTDATLTITVKAGVIAGYPKGFTVELPVTATQQSSATVSVSPSPIALPGIGKKLTLNLDIANGENVAGYQATVSFDHAALRYVESANGNYLQANAFFTNPNLDDYILFEDTSVEDTTVEDTSSLIIAGNTLTGPTNGDGTLATLTFEVIDYKPSTVILAEVYLVDADGKQWEVTTKNGEVIEPPELANKSFGDLNLDGVVNIQDLIIIKHRFGQTGRNIADVNNDLLVDIVDLVLVAGAFDGGAAAPTFHPKTLKVFTAADVQLWLSQAQHIDRTDPKVQRGILFLKQLLTVLTPKETVLLANYPNPFNPETWIPYHLAKDADVTLTIYAIDGQVVRKLGLGHQPAGRYQSRSRAAYWDGKNAFGEPVASGVYFYRLKAGDFTATRKMLIQK